MLGAFGACRKAPPACVGGAPALLELRDRSGALELSLRRAAGDGGAEVCDPAGRRLATLDERGALVLRDPGGAIRLDVRRSAPGEDPVLTRPGRGTPLRLHDERGLLRLLDPIGVPAAQIDHERETGDRDGGHATAFDPGGVPLAIAEAAAGRHVLRGRDGSVQRYVLGLHRDEAAAAFALPGLEPIEQLALARFLDGQPAN